MQTNPNRGGRARRHIRKQTRRQGPTADPPPTPGRKNLSRLNKPRRAQTICGKVVQTSRSLWPTQIKSHEAVDRRDSATSDARGYAEASGGRWRRLNAPNDDGGGKKNKKKTGSGPFCALPLIGVKDGQPEPPHLACSSTAARELPAAVAPHVPVFSQLAFKLLVFLQVNLAKKNS